MDEGEKILARMRVSKAGWRPRDVERLYRHFGFGVREGGNHTLYAHPRYPQLYAAVPRHKPVKTTYITQAVRLIDELKRLEVEHE